MAYTFWGKLGLTKGEKYLRLMEKAQKLGWSFNELQREVMRQGLSYRRADMLDDWRRFSFVSRARTYEGKLTQHVFYEEVVKRLHDEEGWSWKEIKEFLNERKQPERWTPETKVKERIYKSYLSEALPEKTDT